jgi:hypothetical protein
MQPCPFLKKQWIKDELNPLEQIFVTTCTNVECNEYLNSALDVEKCNSLWCSHCGTKDEE